MTEVDVCIISYAKNDELKNVTSTGIRSLLESETHIKFNIFVVESNKSVNYNEFINTETIHPFEPFGYNRYLNIAVRKGEAPYIFLANNDLTYEKDWARAIINAMNNNTKLLSASPFCPQTNNMALKQAPVIMGYNVRQQLAGWAIFQKREIYNIIGRLNEGVDFWFSDNIYADQLIKHNILHALITNSVVNHHSYNLGATGSSILDENKINDFTVGQHNKYLQAKNLLLEKQV